MPPAQHPRHLRRVDTGADLPIPDEVAVAFPGALPKTAPDTIATRRALTHNTPLPPPATTSIDAAVRWIAAWWRGGRKATRRHLIFVRVGEVWHEATAQSEPPEQKELHLLAELVAAMRARYPVPGEAKQVIEQLIRDHLAKPDSRVPLIADPSPQKYPSIPAPTPASVAAEIVRLRPTPTPAAPNPSPKASPNPTPKKSSPSFAPAKSLPVQQVLAEAPKEFCHIDDSLADLVATLHDEHLPADTRITFEGGGVILHLPPSPLDGNPKTHITANVEIRRAKQPGPGNVPGPWICTLNVGLDESTSLLQRDPRAAIDNALLRAAKTPLAPYRAALSAFLGGP